MILIENCTAIFFAVPPTITAETAATVLTVAKRERPSREKGYYGKTQLHTDDEAAKCQRTHTAYTARCTESACSAYRPELYAPELYARAFDLYAKRKADEKEWAEFHPAATIMRYCRQLPAPAPYWEPPTYKTGSCCFCGQLRVLPFAAPTQEEADRYATDKCDCEIGKACRRQREEREIIAGLFAEFEPDTLRLLEATADMVRKDYIKGGTAIKLAENVTAKFKIKDGTVIVTRSEKHEHQHSL